MLIVLTDQFDMRRLFVTLLFLIFANVVYGDVAVFVEPLYSTSSAASYYVKLGVGHPEYRSPTDNTNAYNLLLDTGSANLAIYGDCCTSNDVKTYLCRNSYTCTDMEKTVNVTYTLGQLSGILVEDSLTSPNLGTVDNIPLIQIEEQSDFQYDSFHGILGVAYKSISHPDGKFNTIFDTLVSDRDIPNIFGLHLCGGYRALTESNSTEPVTGHWVVGGTEGLYGEIYHKGDIYYSPLVQEKWYVVLITDIGYNSQSLGLSCSSINDPYSIIDSGTTNLVLPEAVYTSMYDQIYQHTKSIIPNFNNDFFSDSTPCCGLEYCDPKNKDSLLLTLPSISISLAFDGKREFTILIPPEFYWRATQSRGQGCRILGITKGTSLVLGNVFMDGLYIVHDRIKKQVGFAIADTCDFPESKSKSISLKEGTTDWCKCIPSSSKHLNNLLVTYWPWGTLCFIWSWWMYILILCGCVSLVCIIYIGYIVYMRRKKAAKQALEPEYMKKVVTNKP